MSDHDLDAEHLSDFLQIELLQKARSKAVKVDDSLLFGLLNYSRHLGVCELEPDDLKIVLTRIGEAVIERSERIADGAGLGHTLVQFGCDKSMGNCKLAAEKVLGRRIPVRLKSHAGLRDIEY